MISPALLVMVYSSKLRMGAFTKIGIGVPENFNPREFQSMGLQTVFYLIEYQLHGEINWTNYNGLCWNIAICLNNYLV